MRLRGCANGRGREHTASRRVGRSWKRGVGGGGGGTACAPARCESGARYAFCQQERWLHRALTHGMPLRSLVHARRLRCQVQKSQNACGRRNALRMKRDDPLNSRGMILSWMWRCPTAGWDGHALSPAPKSSATSDGGSASTKCLAEARTKMVRLSAGRRCSSPTRVLSLLVHRARRWIACRRRCR